MGVAHESSEGRSMIEATKEKSIVAATAYENSGIATSDAAKRVARSITSTAVPGAIFPVDVEERTLCACASSLSDWNRLVPLLDARIGKTLSDFPTAVQIETAEPLLGQLLGGASPLLWCWIRLPHDKLLQSLALAACAQMVDDVIANAEIVEPPLQKRSPGQLMAALERLLAAGDFAGASEAFEVLRNSRSLDAANIRFLELRLLVAQGSEKLNEARSLANSLRGLDVPKEVKKTIDSLGVE